MADGCEPGYKPYTCTVCVQFTNDEQVYSHGVCNSPGVFIQMEGVQSEILKRYMEVYGGPQYWTGYEFNSGKAVVPGTNISINVPIYHSPSCNGSSCCVAWQLEPFGLISLDCEKKIPAICTTSRNCEFLQLQIILL